MLHSRGGGGSPSPAIGLISQLKSSTNQPEQGDCRPPGTRSFEPHVCAGNVKTTIRAWGGDRASVSPFAPALASGARREKRLLEIIHSEPSPSHRCCLSRA